MTIIEPKTFEVISCDAPDENFPLWQKNAEYKTGDMVIYDGRIYKAIGDFTSSFIPEVDINNFVDFGAVNKMAFSDSLVSSQTKKEISDDSGEFLEIQLNFYDYVDTFAFININAQKIQVEGFDEDFICYSRPKVDSWWDYFYQDVELKNNKIIKLNKKIVGAVTFRVYPVAGLSAVGMLLGGTDFYVGEVLGNAQVGAISYTKKITDEWGNTFIRQGKTAKKNSYEVVTDTHRTDLITMALNRSLERGVCVFVGDSRDSGYDALTVVGILTEFDLAISTLDKSELTIGIEGVI